MGLPFHYMNEENHHLNRDGQREVARRLLPWLNPAWQATEEELTVTDDVIRYSGISKFCYNQEKLRPIESGLT